MDNNTQTNNRNTSEDNNQNVGNTNTEESNNQSTDTGAGNNKPNAGDDNGKSKLDGNLSKQDNNNDDIKAQNEKISNLESKLICYEKGVVKDSVNDVIALAKSYVNDKTDINKAVDMVLKKYPSFASSQNNSNSNFDTGVKSEGDNNTLNGVEKAFYKKNPSLKK